MLSVICWQSDYRLLVGTVTLSYLLAQWLSVTCWNSGAQLFIGTVTRLMDGVLTEKGPVYSRLCSAENLCGNVTNLNGRLIGVRYVLPSE